MIVILKLLRVCVYIKEILMISFKHISYSKQVGYIDHFIIVLDISITS